MEENTNISKIAYAKTLNKLSFSSLLTSTIDSNANIKNVIDVCAYIYDEKIECGNGKAIITGKVGLKALYIDTDNITNTTTSTQSFSETIVDNCLTNESSLMLTETKVLSNIISTEGSLKVSCEISSKPIVFFNLPLNANLNFENMIIKKSTLTANQINQQINNNFEYTSTFETKDSISKILCHNAYYTNSSVKCSKDTLIIEGKLFSTLIYETSEEDETKIKELTDCFNIKTDLNIASLSPDCNIEAFFSVDKSKESITTEVEDNNTIINIVNNIKIVGISIENVTIEVVDDLYSIHNEIELTTTTREFIKNTLSQNFQNSVACEFNLNDNETAIEEVISNTVCSAEITNSYLKDSSLILEGIITSNLVYLDENKQYASKQLEAPFVINTKQEQESILNANFSINIVDYKAKVKRGTIIEVEYQVLINVFNHYSETKEMVDNYTIGKQVNFSNFDYQIYLAKPNETLWELCKRTKTTPELLNEFNKNLPPILVGNEKIIIKR